MMSSPNSATPARWNSACSIPSLRARCNSLTVPV
jgi:hypothetical protein